MVCESHLYVGNLPSKFGHARPLGCRIIRYLRDGRTDRRTDGRTKATLIAAFPMDGGIIIDDTYRYAFKMYFTYFVYFQTLYIFRNVFLCN